MNIGDICCGQQKFRHLTTQSCSLTRSYIRFADELLVTRAFGIIGLLVLVGCVVVGVLLFFMDNKLFLLIASILGFVAGK